MRLKLESHKLLSTFAFNFNLRRHIEATAAGRRAGRHARAARGWAVKVDPINLVLKAPELSAWKLNYDDPLTFFAFNFNLRHYAQVRRCRLTPVDPGLTALGLSA
jgi:hypothetical protein